MIPIRQPLARAWVMVPPGVDRALLTALLPILEAELNIKRIEIVENS